jgi:hypothetical protein
MYKILQLVKNKSVDGCGIGGRGWWKAGGGLGGGQWEAGGGGGKSNGGGRQRRSTTMGGIGQRWMGKDRGSQHLGVAVAAMVVAVVGGGIFYAL